MESSDIALLFSYEIIHYGMYVYLQRNYNQKDMSMVDCDLGMVDVFS